MNLPQPSFNALSSNRRKRVRRLNRRLDQFPHKAAGRKKNEVVVVHHDRLMHFRRGAIGRTAVSRYHAVPV